MDKQEIQKQIDDAIRIFRECLEKTYLEKGKALYGIGIHPFQGFLSGKINIQRLNSGNLKISGEIMKDALNEDCEGLPMKFSDWDIYPLVIALFNKETLKGESNL